jgi:hypothetical protein
VQIDLKAELKLALASIARICPKLTCPVAILVIKKQLWKPKSQMQHTLELFRHLRFLKQNFLAQYDIHSVGIVAQRTVLCAGVVSSIIGIAQRSQNLKEQKLCGRAVVRSRNTIS